MVNCLKDAARFVNDPEIHDLLYSDFWKIECRYKFPGRRMLVYG